jgi:HAD superfamily 5'-nucleotidase-like hydrolase
MTDRLPPVTDIPPQRRIYANRTLNLRSIGAIGYDMDYTLAHYQVETWERRAYDEIKVMLADDGWPVAELAFDPTMVARGLVIDTDLGNVVKANRFGYVMRAAHGTRLLSFDEQRAVYRHTPVDLSEPRFFFLNTPFSLSGSCLFCQLVDLYDRQQLPEVHGYQDLYRRVVVYLDQTHVEGSLKAAIVADPGRYIERDSDLAMALLDQQRSGKRLMLITNAEWPYVRDVMSYTLAHDLPRACSGATSSSS